MEKRKMCKDFPSPMAGPPPRSWDLRITLDEREAFALLTLSGRISGRTSGRLREAIEACKSVKPLLIDLQGVDYLSSSGIRVLSEAAGRPGLVLSVPPGPVQIALELAGLPPSVRLAPSLPAALDGLVKPPAAPGQDLADEPTTADN
jgi:anti-anti-sigma factor